MRTPARSASNQATRSGVLAAGLADIAVLACDTVLTGLATAGMGAFTHAARSGTCAPCGELLLLRLGHCQ